MLWFVNTCDVFKKGSKIEVWNVVDFYCSLVLCALYYFVLSYKGEVIINYNKLHADQKQGKTLDIGEYNTENYIFVIWHTKTK